MWHVGQACDAVVGEVALLHHAVLQRDGRTGQAHAQAHQRSALHLGLHAQRVDGGVAVHTGGDAVQPGRFTVHRCFHHIGHHRAERRVHRHAPGAASRQRLRAITRLGHRQLQRRQVSRVLALPQRLAQRHRVLLGFFRHLVDHRFHHEGSVRVAHRAPPQHRHVLLGVVGLHGHGQRIGRVGHAFHGGAVHAFFDHEGLERRAGDDALADDAVLPRLHRATGRQRHFHAVGLRRAVVAAADVVLAAPHHFQRRRLADRGAKGATHLMR